MSVALHVNNLECEAPGGASVFDCAERLGVQVPTSCRKQGKCKECVVEVIRGGELLSPRVPAEVHLRDGFRLACCARIAGTEGEIHCHTMKRGELRVERHALNLPAGTGDHFVDPAVTRDGDRIFLDGNEIARHAGPIHGLALDIGTTTVVMRLLDLDTGDVVADASFENPQRFGGSDVMARIRYDSEDRSRTLQRTLAGYLAHAIDSLPVDAQSIFEVVVSGNSTMRDLFFRLDVHPIGQSPYQSITELDVAAGRRHSTSLADNARRLGLPVHPKARVVGLPVISGHVGADTAACMLAIDIAHEDRLVALMDIGTNTELIVGNRHKILVASCPAGPAFEGGEIAFGMPGMPGAIERVALDDRGNVAYSTIGSGPPEGICGSGMIDLLSELVRTGRINQLGRFEDGSTEIVVEASIQPQITFSERDINHLAQAKGANVAGLRIVLSEYGIRMSDLEAFYIAGGFGRHVNLEAARRIGLIPDIDLSRVVQVGNASIEGACMALLSRSKREELETLVRRVTHCRLETHPRFFDAFVEGCQFKPIADVLEVSAS